jgi:hypothetical protein
LKLLSLLKVWSNLYVALFGGFLAIFFMISFPSFSYSNFHTSETTINVIVSTSLVLAMGIIYVATQSRLQKSLNLGRISKGIARVIVLAVVAGVIIGMFYSPTFFQGIAMASQFSSFLLKLQIMYREFLQDVIYSTFFLWFTAAFVSISLFDILRIRENNRPNTVRLNNPVVQ